MQLTNQIHTQLHLNEAQSLETEVPMAPESVSTDTVQKPLESNITNSGNMFLAALLNAVGAKTEPLLKAIHGTIQADGSIISGTGFIVNQTSVGVYAITFDKAFDATTSYQVLVTPSVGVDRCVNVTNSSSAIAIVATFNDAGIPTSQQFNFLAIGI